MKKGIVLIATGSNIYIKMAFNLACSIIKCGSGIPVCLFHDESIGELNEIQQFMFTKKVMLTPDQKRNPFLAKLFINEMSPFEETIYLDVDMICSPYGNLNSLFDQLQDVEFTIANRGKDVKTDWVTWDKPMWDLSSEFMYFKKTDKVAELFDTARNFYLTSDKVKRLIGDCLPDEPSLSYAMDQLNIEPHKSPYHPSYWVAHGYEPEKNILSNYQFLSMGGNALPVKIVKLYNKWATIYAGEIGSGWFPFVQKRTLKERILL